MVSLSDALKKFVKQVGADKTFWVALSGGLDSSVLLHLVATLRSYFPIQVKAIHVHHGLSQHADAWLQHCETVCHNLQIEYIAKKIHAHALPGESGEEVARELRYQIFSALLAEKDILLTAHQKDDQAETVLLQLLRGAGMKGLAAMPRLKCFAKGFHGRPLLDFSRAELFSYAKENQLQWIDDESNANTKFTRNFIRHDVMPLLKSRWPSVQDALARSAVHCANAEILLNDVIRKDLQDVMGSSHATLSVRKLLQFDRVRQQYILRQWISDHHFSLPSTIKMQHILQDVLQASQDRTPCISWGDVELRRYRDNLYLMNNMPSIPHKSFSWNLEKPLDLGGNRILRATPVIGEGLSAEIKNVTVRFRKGGEKFQLPGRKHHHDLKKLFQAWGVAPWLREQVPLIFVEEELAAIVGFGVAEPFVTVQQGWKLTLET